MAIKCQFLSLLLWKWPEHCKEMQHNELMLAQQAEQIPLPLIKKKVLLRLILC